MFLIRLRQDNLKISLTFSVAKTKHGDSPKLLKIYVVFLTKL